MAKFNILALPIFILTVVNFSVDFVIYERFHEQRRANISSSSSRKRCIGSGGRTARRANEKKSGGSLIGGVTWTLEYYQIGPLLLLINLAHILLLVYLTLKSIIFASVSNERDAKTNQLKQPILRYMEENYLVDYLFVYARSSQFNRLNALVLGKFLVLRIRNLYIRFRNAQINKFAYKKLSTVQLLGAYFAQMETSLSGWLQFLVIGAKHKCKQVEAGWRTQEMSDRLYRMDKIDRLYYHNLIDYDSCYEGIDIFKKYPPDEAPRAKLIAAGNDPYPSKLQKSAHFIRGFFTILKPNRRYFVPIPMNRVDLSHIFGMVALYVLANLPIFIFFVVVTNLVWLSNMRYLGLNTASLWSKVIVLTQSPKNIMAIAEGMISMLLISLNLTDNCLIGMASVACRARTTKVLSLLENEIAFYQRHLDRQRLGLITDRTDANRLGGIWAHEYANRVNISPFESANSSYNINMRATGGRGGPQIASYGSETLFYSRPKLTVTPIESELEFTYKSIYEFNENIRYLFELIGILLDELKDMKLDFTFSMNMAILLGTIGTAVGLSFLADTTDSFELIFIIIIIVAETLPLLLCLLLGAIAESMFRKICHSLMPLMVNEARIVNISNLLRMQKLHKHLLCEENRAFYLLGNIPLTYGTMGSILGWMATASSLLSRSLDKV